MKVDTVVVGSRYGLEISKVGYCVVGLQVQKKLHPFHGPFFLRRLFSACRDMPRDKAAMD